MIKHMEFTFLGRVLGTFTGWDGDLGDSWHIYNFKPIPALKNTLGFTTVDCFGINETKGLFELYDNEGNVTQSWDIIKILSTIEPIVENRS